MERELSEEIGLGSGRQRGAGGLRRRTRKMRIVQIIDDEYVEARVNETGYAKIFRRDKSWESSSTPDRGIRFLQAELDDATDSDIAMAVAIKTIKEIEA
jgi:hypothetical protein